LPPENSPYAAYDRLFSDALANPDDVTRAKARRKAVLDSVRGDFDRLQSKLGASDREKLESHMISLQTIRDRFDAPSLEFAGACQPLDQSEIVDPEVVANMATTGRLQMDLLAMALACDLTRVGSIMWGYSTADHVYDWVDSEITEGHHLLAHKGDEDTDKVAQNVEINTWFASQLAYFIELRSGPEGHFAYRKVALDMFAHLQRVSPLFAQFVRAQVGDAFLGRMQQEQTADERRQRRMQAAGDA